MRKTQQVTGGGASAALGRSVAGTLVATILLTGLMFVLPSRAHANTPACGSNHSSWALTNCTASNTYFDIICNASNGNPNGAHLRAGPSIDYALHGWIISSGWERYKFVNNGVAVNAGCGGPTTNQWNLSLVGWVSRSGTTAVYT